MTGASQKQKWKFKLYNINQKTKQVDFIATCTTKEMGREECKKLIQIEMTKYKYDFWEIL